MSVRLLVGDVRERIREIPDGSVDVVMCSPPFLALRKYGDNAAEMGSERTPADFLDALLELTGEFRRVLTPHGSIAIELGDTYSGSTASGGDYQLRDVPDGQRRTRRESFVLNGVQPNTMRRQGDAWPPAKSLTLIPTLYPASLAYGWNMLNPAHTFDRWRVRNVIVWARPNPPVGALGDKVRPATSYITVACTSAKRWFDLDAVRTDIKFPESEGSTRTGGAKFSAMPGDGVSGGREQGMARYETSLSNPAGAPPLDWWEDDDPTGHATLVLPTQPYPGAHYATWPEALASRLMKMMCPTRVCTTCGEPSRRVVGEVSPRIVNGADAGKDRTQGRSEGGAFVKAHTVTHAVTETLGWSDCGHDTWRPGRILDPFCGSGTTLAVAQGLGRDATGVELYPENAHLCRERCGMYLDIDGAVA